jgi:hypothetical protein
VGEEGRIGGEKRTRRSPVVEPEGSCSSVIDFDISELAESVHFIIDDLPKVAVSLRDKSVRRNISQDPVLPRGRIIGEKFVEKFHEKAFILKFQVFDTQTTAALRGLDGSPGNKTLRSVALVFTGREEGALAFLNGFDNSFRNT